MLHIYSSNKKFDTLFIVCLFVLFSFTSCILVLICARQYQSTSNSINKNYEVRTTDSYLNEKIHQYDTSDGISITDIKGTDTLKLTEKIDGKNYITYIYYYDGYLRELFVSDDSLFSPETGQEIVPLSEFHAKIVRSGLVLVTYKDSSGISHNIYLNIHSSTGKEPA